MVGDIAKIVATISVAWAGAKRFGGVNSISGVFGGDVYGWAGDDIGDYMALPDGWDYSPAGGHAYDMAYFYKAFDAPGEYQVEMVVKPAAWSGMRPSRLVLPAIYDGDGGVSWVSWRVLDANGILLNPDLDEFLRWQHPAALFWINKLRCTEIGGGAAPEPPAEWDGKVDADHPLDLPDDLDYFGMTEAEIHAAIDRGEIIWYPADSFWDWAPGFP